MTNINKLEKFIKLIKLQIHAYHNGDSDYNKEEIESVRYALRVLDSKRKALISQKTKDTIVQYRKRERVKDSLSNK